MTVPHRFFIDIDALSVSICGKVSQYGSGTTTNIEDPALICSALAYISAQDLEQDPSPAHEPPVDILHLAVLAVVLSLQISLELLWARRLTLTI